MSCWRWNARWTESCVKRSTATMTAQSRRKISPPSASCSSSFTTPWPTVARWSMQARQNRPACARARALSSEVETGSRQDNASNQRSQSSASILSKRKRLEAAARIFGRVVSIGPRLTQDLRFVGGCASLLLGSFDSCLNRSFFVTRLQIKLQLQQRPRLDGAARGPQTICSLNFKFDQAPLAQS